MSEKVCTGTISLECKPKPTPPPPPPPPKPSQPTFYYLLAVLGILVLTGANAANFSPSAGDKVCHTNDCHEPEVRYHKRILKHGSRGEDVKKLQKLLNARGLCPEPIALDGVFGPTTLHAVKKFQRQADIPVDGIVGGKTWDRLFAGS